MKKTRGCIVKRGSIYYLRYTINKHVRQKSLGVTTLKEAEAERDRILTPALTARTREDIVHHVAAVRKLSEPRRDDIPLSAVWAAYLACPTRPDSGKSTLAVYKRRVDKLLGWLGANRPLVVKLKDLTQGDAEAFVVWLKSVGVSASTFNGILFTLRLVTRKLMGESPFDQITPKKDPCESRSAFTREDVRRLLAAVDNPELHVSDRGEMRTLFVVGAYTGLRLGDALGLKWEHVDFGRNQISLTPRKTSRQSRRITVTIPMEPILREMLSKLPRDGSPHVMPTLAARGSARTDHVGAAASRIIRLSGFKTADENLGVARRLRRPIRYSFHSLRHGFASFHANNGVPLTTLAAMLGDNPQTLARYYVKVSHEALSGVLTTPERRIAEAVSIIEAADMDDDLRRRILNALGKRVETVGN